MSDLPAPTEFAALVARVRAGDEAAVAELVQKYEGRVRLTARVLLGPALRPHLDSLDVAQSVHRVLLAGLKTEKFRLDSPEQLLSLLLTVVRRKVAHHWRKAKRQERANSGESTADAAGLLGELASTQASPDESAAMSDAIQRVLAGLTEVDRRLIELRLAGASTVEAASELGIDARVLRARLSRLRQKLRSEGVLTEWL